MPRALTMLRAGAELIAHPSRWRQWRRHLGRAWRAPTSSTRHEAQPRRFSGPSPRPVRALVLGRSALTERLRPEWEQVDSWQAPDTGIDLTVVVWPAQPASLPDLPSGVPVVVWDEADVGTDPCPLAEAAALVAVSIPERAADYPGRDVLVHSAAVQPRRHNPAITSGTRVPRGRLTDVGADPVLDPITALLGPPVRDDRAYEVATIGSAAPRTRVLELLGEGCVVLSSDPGAATHARAVTVVETSDLAEQELLALGAHAELRRRRAQVGVREVLSEHTSTAAVDAVLSRLGIAEPRRRRPVSAIVPTMRPSQIGHVLEFVARQSHEQVQLVLVTHGFDADADVTSRATDLGVDLAVVAAAPEMTLGAVMNLGVDVADGEYVAKMDDDNHYGPHYLRDLLATFDFSGAQVAGKWAHLTHLESSGATFLRFPHAENTLTRLVQGGTLVLPRQVASDLRFENLPRRVDTTFLDKVAAAGGLVYSADRYNFVSVRGASVEGHTWKITDSELLAKPSAELFFGKPWDHADI